MIIFLLLFSVPPLSCFAANVLDIVINEIAWMGTESSYNDEWIELYNNTNSSINLEGWILKSEDGAPEIKLTGAILANGFFLLERTDEKTLPDITAGQIYKGTLGNSGENLKLFDSLGRIVDQTDCGLGWFTGDNKTKQTMERKNSKISGSDASNWQTSQSPAGTPEAQNSTVLTRGEKSPEKNFLTAEPTGAGPLSDYPKGIVFNEILPSPEGSDEKEEWIEIFNQNSFEANLSDWEIKDVLGKITAYVFPKETKISPQGFLVLSRPETKITLNNDEDGLVLISPDGKTIDEINYKKAHKGESYSRIDSDWLWSSALTPGAVNVAPSFEPLRDESSLKTKKEEELAAAGEQLPKSSKFLYVLLIAFSFAVFFGIIILITKIKLRAYGLENKDKL